MVSETITERGIKSTTSCVSLVNGTNSAPYNYLSGTASAATLSTLTLAAADSSCIGRVIEIIYGAGKDQARLITDVSGNVVTVSPNFTKLPDTTSVYVVHQNSGICPDQTQSRLSNYMILNSTASSVDNFYLGCYMKLVEGNGKGQIFKCINYTGSTRLFEYTPNQKIPPLNDTLYVIYGEGGLAASATNNTLVLDGNQVNAQANHYIEIISGAGEGQIRKISSISGNTATISVNWGTNPDNTSRYVIFGGWGSEYYENVLRHALITVQTSIDVEDGEQSILVMCSAMTQHPETETETVNEFSNRNSSTTHAITVTSEFFRVKVVGMGYTLNGYVQVIYNSYKSGKVTSKVSDVINDHTDCQLNRSVIVGKTVGEEYKNIISDTNGSMCVSVKNPVDGFGSIVMTQPRQFAEIMFMNNYINPVNVTTRALNSGTATVTNNICSINAGSNANGRSYLSSARRMRYNPGLAICIRFAALFSPPIANSSQLIGYGDCCDGFFVGYNGTSFGILHRRGGLNEIRRLTITATSATDTTATVTLDGVATNVSILATDSKQQIARKIVNTSFAAVGSGWITFEEGESVLFTSCTAAPLTGTFSYSSTTSTGTFSSVQSGVVPTDTWTTQYNWNQDRALGFKDLPCIDFTNGNVFEINMQWLGFGNIIFRMEHPTTGTFYDIHHIRYSAKNTLTSLLNPNLPLHVAVEKFSAASTDIFVKTSSMGLFVMGDNNKVLGPRLGKAATYYTLGGNAMSAGTYYNIITLRNLPIFNNTRNYSEIYALAASFSFGAGSAITRGGIFTVFLQPVLDNSTETLVWTKRNAATSTVDYCTNVVSISGGNELLSFVFNPMDSTTLPLTDLELFIPPGYWITIAFKPYSALSNSVDTNAADFGFSASWIQR